MLHEKLAYIEKRHSEKREFVLMPPGVDLGDTYPSVPCPTCAASWFEGCCREGFCPERVEAMAYYDSLSRDEQTRIHDEDWKRFLNRRNAEDKAKRDRKKMEDSGQLEFFEFF